MYPVARICCTCTYVSYATINLDSSRDKVYKLRSLDESRFTEPQYLYLKDISMARYFTSNEQII